MSTERVEKSNKSASRKADELGILELNILNGFDDFSDTIAYHKLSTNFLTDTYMPHHPCPNLNITLIYQDSYSLGILELNILNGFDDFSDTIEKIQNRPEFKEYNKLF